MVPRIRTVKPELARHELLFDAERETGLPLRFGWVMLFTVCDREGRFRWLPRRLKPDVLPYEDVDFSRVLDAWLTRGLLVKYRVGDAWYGCIPTWRKHQSVNHRESPSELPSLEDAEEVVEQKQELTDASATRHGRAGACPGNSRGEGEGEGELEREDSVVSSLRSETTDAGRGNGASDTDATIWTHGVNWLRGAGVAERQARSELGKLRKRAGDEKLAEVIGRGMLERPVDPVAWLEAATTPKKRGLVV